jgi:hypothetical protein
MELYLLIVALLRFNKWLMKHDMQLYTKEEIEELRAKSSVAGKVAELPPSRRID